MANYQDVFARYEKKYMLDHKQLQLLIKKLGPVMAPDQYGVYTICNVYYDTDDFRLIRASLEKPVYKEKLRLRSYGVPKTEDAVFLELKKKYKGIVYKRRVSLPLAQARAYLDRGVLPAEDGQIFQEIDWFLHFHRPSAKAYIAYDRQAYCCPSQEGLRVTFDRNIRFRETLLELDKGDWGQNILAPGQTLMELKIPGVMPLWLSRLLSELSIYPISFSKYGECYRRYLSKTKGGLLYA